MRVPVLLVLVMGLAAGCVTRATYEAEQAANAALRDALELRDMKIEEQRVRVRDLESTRETLELEQRSAEEERLQLIEGLEQLRTGNVELRENLQTEREMRAEREVELAELGGTYGRLVEQLEGEISNRQLEIEELRGQVHVRALEKILFASGSAALKEQGRQVLGKLAVQLRDIPGHTVRVEGHTDTVPIATPRFPSNWELSAARAAGVARFLVEQGLEAATIEAVGRGEHEPIADNTTPQGRARNRRIEIVLVPKPGA